MQGWFNFFKDFIVFGWFCLVGLFINVKLVKEIIVFINGVGLIFLVIIF